MPILKVFKSTMPSLNFVTRKGTNLAFRAGRYHTERASEIAELEEEIKSGHPHIFIDPNETEIDTTLQDEIAKAKAEAEARVLKEHEEKLKAEGKGTELQKGPSVAQTASPAQLLGVTTSGALTDLSGLSNSK